MLGSLLIFGVPHITIVKRCIRQIQRDICSIVTALEKITNWTPKSLSTSITYQTQMSF